MLSIICLPILRDATEIIIKYSPSSLSKNNNGTFGSTDLDSNLDRSTSSEVSQ